jgi:hypothetical protein
MKGPLHSFFVLFFDAERAWTERKGELICIILTPATHPKVTHQHSYQVNLMEILENKKE